MVCPSCHTAVESGRDVCPTCGARIWSPVAPTVPVPIVGTPSSWPPPITEPAPITEPVPVTEPLPIQITEQIPITAPLPVTPPTPDDALPRLTRTLFVIGSLATVLALVGALVDVGTVIVTGVEVPSVTWQLDDMASNLLVAACIAAGLVLAGSLLTRLRRASIVRLAIGLSGGAGLALAGVAAHVIGQSIDAFDEVKSLLVHSGQSYTLRTTKELGFWLLGGAGVLGLVVFVLALLALRGSPALGSRAAMVAAAVVGTLASVAAAVGPLVPEHGASFVDQFHNDGTPPLTSILRTTVVVLVLVGGAVGFLVRRPWGLAMAFGSASVAMWLTVSTLLEFGGRPIGLAGGNPTTRPERIPQPNLVTCIGLAVTVVALLVGYTAALARRTASAATR